MGNLPITLGKDPECCANATIGSLDSWLSFCMSGFLPSAPQFGRSPCQSQCQSHSHTMSTHLKMQGPDAISKPKFYCFPTSPMTNSGGCYHLEFAHWPLASIISFSLNNVFLINVDVCEGNTETRPLKYVTRYSKTRWSQTDVTH